MKLQQCMGGWCPVRDKCGHYWAPMQRSVPPSERLCMPNDEGRAMQALPVDLAHEGKVLGFEVRAVPPDPRAHAHLPVDNAGVRA